MIQAIDCLILDLGGVLIDVDYAASARAFAQHGVPDFEHSYSKARQANVFDRFETGHLSPHAFRDAVRSMLGVPLSDEAIDTCWNAMLGTIPPERIALVERLSKRLPVLLLSNTNAIHVPAFEAIIRRDLGITDFKGLFNGAYYSCELGMRKPNTDIFHYVVDRHRLDPSRTLFVDDSIQHVLGARKAGLQAEHLELEREDVMGLMLRLGMVD